MTEINPKTVRGPVAASGRSQSFFGHFSAITEGYLGTFYEKMSPENFWLMHVAIPATGTLLFLIFGPALKRAMDRPDPGLFPIPNVIGVAA